MISASLSRLRVLVTRPRSATDELPDRLTSLGATVIQVPLIAVEPVPGDPLEAFESLTSVDWIVFSSANAVSFFMEALERRGLRLDERIRIAAVGPATAAEASRRGVVVHLIPPLFRAEELVSALAPRLDPGSSVLVPRAREGRDVLLTRLEQAGAKVLPMVLYETLPRAAAAPELRACLEVEAPGVIVVASGSAVRALVELAPDPAVRAIPLACIGPVTASTAEKLGFGRILVAPEASLDGLVRLLIDTFGPEQKPCGTPGSVGDFGLT